MFYSIIISSRKYLVNLTQSFYWIKHNKNCLARFCPECGGEIKFDSSSNSFVCKSCGLFASREKIEELIDKVAEDKERTGKRLHDDYLDWWQTSKKNKQKY